jgi:hypothetical protein
MRTDVSEEHVSSIIRVKRITELGKTANVVPSSLSLFTLMMEAAHSSEKSALIRATRCHIPDDSIFHSHRRENLRFYMKIFDSPMMLSLVSLHLKTRAGISPHIHACAVQRYQVGPETEGNGANKIEEGANVAKYTAFSSVVFMGKISA